MWEFGQLWRLNLVLWFSSKYWEFYVWFNVGTFLYRICLGSSRFELMLKFNVWNNVEFSVLDMSSNSIAGHGLLVMAHRVNTPELIQLPNMMSMIPRARWSRQSVTVKYKQVKWIGINLKSNMHTQQDSRIPQFPTWEDFWI